MLKNLSSKVDRNLIHIPQWRGRGGTDIVAWRDNLEFTYRLVKKQVDREFKEREREQIQEAIKKRLENFTGAKKRMLKSILEREGGTGRIDKVITGRPEKPIITDREEIKIEVERHFKEGNKERRWKEEWFSER